MKQGMELSELADELTRQQKLKRDFIADSRSVRMAEDGKTLVIADKPEELNENEFERLMARPVEGPLTHFIGEATNHFHSQLGTKLKIPMKYYRRMQEETPRLLATNVNRWLVQNPMMRMVRTLDGQARAYLSNRYRPRDNVDLMEAVYPKLVDRKLKIESCNVTPTYLYLKAIWPGRVERHWTTGDGTGPHDFYEEYQPGIVIGNSEVGCSSTYVTPGVYIKGCTNLAVFSREGIRKFHLGRALGDDEGISEFLSDETIRKDDAAFFAKVGDMVDACLDGKLFEKIVSRMKEANNDKIKDNPKKVIEVVRERYSLTEKEGDGVLACLARGGNMSRLGLSQALTRYSQDIKDYDRASEFERFGGRVIELEKTEWDKIAAA